MLGLCGVTRTGGSWVLESQDGWGEIGRCRMKLPRPRSLGLTLCIRTFAFSGLKIPWSFSIYWPVARVVVLGGEVKCWDRNELLLRWISWTIRYYVNCVQHGQW